MPVLTPEIISPSLRVVALPHPFSMDRVDLTLPAGGTIADIMKAAGVRPGLPARVFVDDLFVHRDLWPLWTPEPGQFVSVRVVPTDGGGGGKDPLRIVLMIAVVAAVIATGQIEFLTALGPMYVAGAQIAVSLAGSLLVNALIPPARPRLADLSGTLAAESPTFSITGTQNQANPYGPIPKVCGTHKMFPPYGAQPYTEIVGNDQYLRLLFIVGYGPLQLSDFKIGGTPLINFTGVEMEIRQGYPTDTPFTLIPDVVHEDAYSIALTVAGGSQVRTSRPNTDELSVDVAFPGGLVLFDGAGNQQLTTVNFTVEYRLVGAGGWTTLGAAPSVAATLTTALSGANNDLLFTANAAGDAGNAISIEYLDPGFVPGDVPTETVYVTPGPTGLNTAIQVQLRSVGGVLSTAAQVKTAIQGDATANALVTVANAPANNGTGVVVNMPPTLLAGGITSPASLSATDKRASLVRVGIRWPVANGTYDVRLTRTTADAISASQRDLSFWSALRSITKTNPVRKSGLAGVALRIKATDQLNGVINQFSLTAQSIVPDWNGTSWVQRVSSTPAAHYREAFQSAANARALADARLDLATLQTWAEDSTAKGKTFNHVFDYRTTVFEALKTIAAAGRAAFGMRDGTYSAVRDVPQTVPIQIVTSRNSWGYRYRKVFKDSPHAFKVRFINELADYQQDERIVYDDGYNADGSGGLIAATKFEGLELIGVTHPDNVWRDSRYHMAVGRLRPDAHEVLMDVENVRCTRGDLALVTLDVPEFGLGAARVKSVAVSGGNATAMTMDDAIPMEAGKDYAVRIRQPLDTSVLSQVVTVAGEQTTVTFTTPLAPADSPAVGDLVQFGLLGHETVALLVKTIEPDQDMNAKLTLLDAAPAVHDAETGAIPAYDSQITRAPVLQQAPAQPIIDAVQSDESVLVRALDGALESRILIALHFASGGTVPVSGIQVRFRPTGSTSSYSQMSFIVSGDADQVSVHPVQDGVSYDLLVRTTGAFGQTSEWVPINGHTVVGKTSLPPDVTGLVMEGRLLRWVYASPPLDLAGFRVREIAGLVPTWSAGTPSHEGLLTDPNFRVLLRDGVWTFMVKAEDVAGNQSANVVAAVHDFGTLSLETEFGDTIPTNLILATDLKAAGFPGTVVNGTISAGNLVADGDGTKFWVSDDSQLFWKSDTATFWPAANYLAMTYTAELIPDPDKLDALLSFPVTVAGESWHVDYRPDSQALFWGDDATLFWDAGTDTFWPAKGDFILWPGVLAALRRQSYELRVTVDAGPTQGVLSACEADWDVRDIEETLHDIAIGAGGTRLPIVNTYRSVTDVHGTLLDDGGTAERLMVMDKLATGPLIKAWDGAAVLTTAHGDFRVKGY